MRYRETTLRFLACIFLLAILTGLSRPAAAQGAAADSAAADSLEAGDYTYRSVRGFERNEHQAGSAFRKTVNALLWPPRALIDLTLTSAGFSAVLIDEKKIIKKFEDIFYLYDHKFGWFPVLNIVTGNPRGLGLSFFYREKYFGAGVKGAFSNSDIWGIKGELNHVFFKYRYFWNLELIGRLQNDDNFRFYGIGADPQNDPRSQFRPDGDAEYGVYSQRRAVINFNLGVRPAGDWEFFFSSFYQKRTVRNPADAGIANIDDIFLSDSLPGAQIKSKKLYNELSFRFDNRPNLSIISPGARIEGYAGLSVGFKNDNERLLRSGFDLSAYIPVLRRNRVIIPRIVFDMVEDLGDGEQIAFVEYPRHLSFRGVNDKTLLRSDNYMMVPSLEYQWPLTYHISAHLFADYLMVSDTPLGFDTANAPWAVGFGMAAHTRFSELMRMNIAYGSEGIFLKFSFGLSFLYKDRSDWK